MIHVGQYWELVNIDFIIKTSMLLGLDRHTDISYYCIAFLIHVHHLRQYLASADKPGVISKEHNID